MARKSGGLTRRRPFREPRCRFILYCEGRKTEPTYFAALRHIYRHALVEIEAIPSAGVPLTIAKSSVAKAKELGLSKNRTRKLNSFEENDQVWAVFDRDQHPNFNQAVTCCQQAGVGVARSNPCFEVWLILHICDYDKPDGRRDCQAHLEGLRPEYKKDGSKTVKCVEIVKYVEEAEKRASQLLERRRAEAAPFGPPSTTVGYLTQEIRAAAKRAN